MELRGEVQAWILVRRTNLKHFAAVFEQFWGTEDLRTPLWTAAWDRQQDLAGLFGIVASTFEEDIGNWHKGLAMRRYPTFHWPGCCKDSFFQSSRRTACFASFRYEPKRDKLPKCFCIGMLAVHFFRKMQERSKWSWSQPYLSVNVLLKAFDLSCAKSRSSSRMRASGTWRLAIRWSRALRGKSRNPGTCPTATTKMTRRPWGPEHTLSKRTTAAFRGNWQVSRTSSWRLSVLHYLAERWWYLY